MFAPAERAKGRAGCQIVGEFILHCQNCGQALGRHVAREKCGQRKADPGAFSKRLPVLTNRIDYESNRKGKTYSRDCIVFGQHNALSDPCWHEPLPARHSIQI